MKSLARLFNFPGYKVIDVQVSVKDRNVRIILKREAGKLGNCHKCGGFLSRKRGQHSRKIAHLPMLGFKTFIEFWQFKGHCSKCKVARKEGVSFASPDSPHFSRDYGEWLGTMCEFTSVKNVAEFFGHPKNTIRRLDHRRLKRLVKDYKIPDVTSISVDEVYAWNTPLNETDCRDDQFLTIISDLKTHKVIWVSMGRNKKSLDQFFELLGTKQCAKIEAVAVDQHAPYAASVRQHCKNALIVWDRFHIMKSLGEALNEERKTLHHQLANGDPLVKLTLGQYRFNFLKKADRRDEDEQAHIDDVCAQNKKFLELELIKEKMFTLFDQRSETEAKEVLDEATLWTWQANFPTLKKWFENIQEGWDTLKNYFQYRITSSLSEGLNKVIKMIKRRAFGYRDPEYFRLKILQVCGYLNRKYLGVGTVFG